MPETVLEPPPGTQPPPATQPQTQTPNSIFDTPKVDPKPLEPPPGSNFMADLTKAFQKEVGEGQQPPPATAEPAPKPVETPPPAETKPPLPEPPETFTPKAKERWRAREEDWHKERSTLQSKQKELEGRLEPSAKRILELEGELAKARETLTERNHALERFDVEHSPLFKEKVLEPEESVRNRLAKQDLQPNEIAALLSGNITHREQILENPRISSYRKGQIIQLLDKWDEVQDTRQQMVSNGKKSLEDYARQQAETESNRKAQFIREAQQVYEDESAQLMGKLEPFVEIPDNKEWNDAVAQRKTWAKALYSGAIDRQTLARAAMWAAAGPVYRELLGMALSRVQELNTAVEKMRGVQPTVRDSGGDTQIIQPTRPISDGDFVKNLVERFNKEAIS